MSKDTMIYTPEDTDDVKPVKRLELTYDPESLEKGVNALFCGRMVSIAWDLSPQNLAELGVIFLALAQGKITDSDRIREILEGFDLDIPECVTLD